jgi:peptidoglycan-associated lipoprotein
MIRNRFWLSFVVFSLAVSASSCASKKGPEGAAAGAGAGGTEASAAAGGEAAPLAGGSVSESSAATMPTVYFDYNQAAVRADAKEPLKAAAEKLKGQGTAQVTIEGHCDERGSSEYNLALGERRAQSVKNYLRNLGVDSKRLATISYGKERPIDPAHTEDAWAKNRRAELIVNR